MIHVAQYKSKTGLFKRDWAWEALETGNLDSATFWSGFFHDSILATVFKALHMVPVTSAATERNWSIRGAIHTEVRNR
jgi:hypothetical protein